MKKITFSPWFLVLFFFFGTYWYCFDSKLDLNGDNVTYYLLGQSFSEGNGFSIISKLGIEKANHFPPGYPLLVAGLIKLFGTSLIPLKIFNGLLLGLSIVIIILISRLLNSSFWISICTALMLIVNQHLLHFSSIIMSEMSYLFVSSLCILSIIKYENDQYGLKSKWYYLSILCVIISYYMRTIGIALFISYCVHFMYKREYKILALSILLWVAALIPLAIKGQGSSYIKQLLLINPFHPELGYIGLTELIERFSNNLLRYINIEIPSALAGFPADYSSQKGYWILGIIMIICILVSLKKLKVAHIFLRVYLLIIFGILFLWVEQAYGIRYIIIIIPILTYLFVNGAWLIIDKLTSTIKFTLHPSLLLILPIFGLPGISHLHDFSIKEHPSNWQNYFIIADWVNKNTPQESIIAVRKPGIFHLYSQRKTYRYLNSKYDEKIISDMKINSVDYVVQDQLGYSSGEMYLFPAIDNNEEHFPRILHVTNPFSSLHEFIADPGISWKLIKDGNYNEALDSFINELSTVNKLEDKYKISLLLQNIGILHNKMGNYNQALRFLYESLQIKKDISDKIGIANTLYYISNTYLNSSNYLKALDLLNQSTYIQKDIGIGMPLKAIIALAQISKYNNGFNLEQIQTLIKDANNLEYELNYRIYLLLSDTFYLETAYNQIQGKADNLKDGAKFLSYPIPKAIVEEWEKVK